MSFAVATIDGRMTADPEVKEIGGSELTTFSLAVDQYNGPNKDKTPQYWDCECWTAAQKILKFLKKGDAIAVSGELRQNTSTNKEGQNRRYYSLRVFQVGNLPARGGSDGERIRKESGKSDDDGDFF